MNGSARVASCGRRAVRGRHAASCRAPGASRASRSRMARHQAIADDLDKASLGAPGFERPTGTSNHKRLPPPHLPFHGGVGNTFLKSPC